MVGVWIRVQFVDNEEYSLSSQQSQINLIQNFYSATHEAWWQAIFLNEFHSCKAEQPLGEMELQEPEKDENQIGNLIKNSVY